VTLEALRKYTDKAINGSTGRAKPISKQANAMILRYLGSFFASGESGFNGEDMA
jgi:hypothetical protein